MQVRHTKHKLRQFKKIEKKIRFHGNKVPLDATLVWDEFFDLSDGGQPSKAIYDLKQLAGMEREAFKEVTALYFYRVYAQYYDESGITDMPIYDAKILALLGLPTTAGYEDIKRKFRQLVKKYHPDVGGTSGDFVKVMRAYDRLLKG